MIILRHAATHNFSVFQMKHQGQIPIHSQLGHGALAVLFRQLLSGQQQSRADTQPWEFLSYSPAVVMAGLRLQGFKPFAMVWGRGGSK